MKIVVLLLNIVFLIGLLPAGMMAITSPMLFDSGATNRTWTILACALALPILILVAQYFAWTAYNRGDYMAALKSHLLPLADILMIGILFMISDKLT